MLQPDTCIQATRDNGENLTGALKFSVRFLCAFFHPKPDSTGIDSCAMGCGWRLVSMPSEQWEMVVVSAILRALWAWQSEMIKCNRTVITFHLTRNASHSVDGVAAKVCGL